MPGVVAAAARFRVGDLAVFEGRVRAGEVDVAADELLDTVAGTAAGVVENDVGVLGELVAEMLHGLCCAVDPSPLIALSPSLLHEVASTVAAAAVSARAAPLREIFTSGVAFRPAHTPDEMPEQMSPVSRKARAGVRFDARRGRWTNARRKVN